MIKKSMLAAFVAALAFAALPALASATYPNPYLAEKGTPVEHTAFAVSADEKNVPLLRTTGGSKVECNEGVSGNGEFETAETGWMELKFHDCHTIFNISCTTSGSPSRTITTTKLPFHLKTVDHPAGTKTPGVLITPGPGLTKHSEPHFATFECGFVGTVEVGGGTEDPRAGIVGTITSPKEETPSNTATITFESEEGGKKAGHQTHRTVTNDEGKTTEYDLKASVNGGATETASEDAKGIITFAGGKKPEILTTAK